MVIGFGNELRGDDAVGPRAARRIAALGPPGLRCLSLQQLTPELAAELPAFQGVIFIDATPLQGDSAPKIQPLEPSAGSMPDLHALNPGGLLALSHALYGQYPRAWMVTVPVSDFAFGETLSSMAQAGLAAAVDKILEMTQE